jgi:5-methylcytosine-specific restriction endonuclease McrA
VTLHAGGQVLRRVRAYLADRDGRRCGRCGESIDMALSGMHPMGATVGHVIPVARGGTDHPGNLRLEHRRCNLAAGDRLDPPRAAIAHPVEVE